MTEAERENIERACERLSIAYAYHVDFGDYDAFADLFAIDGVLEAGRPSNGREALRTGIKKSRSPLLRSRHVLTNVRIEVVDADHATGVTYLSLYRWVCDEAQPDGPLPLAGPAGVGHYQDRFVRTAEGWRFAHRKLFFAFHKDAPAPAASAVEVPAHG